MRAIAGALLIVAAAICFAAAVIAAQIASGQGGGRAPELGPVTVVAGGVLAVFGFALLVIGLGSDGKK